MASRQHLAWLARGGKWRLCAPGIQLRDQLRAAGYTVYDLGNEEHLDHQPPEDHTPYSATGWPARTAPYGVVFAVDIMPPDNVARAKAGKPPLPSLQVLGRKLHDDKAARLFPPIKYINWGPVDDQHAVHCSWQPGHAQTSSSDTGHIHISFRTDMADWSGAYDPLGGDLGMSASEIIEAWAVGMPKTSGGSTVEPVKWRVRDEAWQAATSAQLSALTAAIQAMAKGGTSVDTAAVIAAVRDAGTQTNAVVQALQAEVEDLRSRLAAAGAGLAGGTAAH
ncbi:hypothetical protein [Dactylosporangium salmoneum]|uniref:Uncharacterized protein n=1 Tax=Dactylosporangium salmoneum TaxID=53361 RepID=A0ABN3G9F7_9ACTN